MAVDEQKLRRSLHDRLEAALGADEAALLMEYLPPVGWADIATKHDLDHFAMVTKQDLDHLAMDIGALRSEFSAELRAGMAELKASLLMWMIPTVIGSIGISVTLARLT